jgi:small-conductance mechanosensitive channel
MCTSETISCSFYHVLMICRSIVKHNYRGLIVAYGIILLLVTGIVLSYTYLHDIYPGGGIRLSTHLVLMFLSLFIYIFAWFGSEIEQRLNNPNYKISLKHFKQIAKHNSNPYYGYYYWIKVYSYAIISLASLVILIILGPFTFFLPYCIFKAHLIFIPYFALIQTEPLSSKGIGDQMKAFFKFNYHITSKLRWKIFGVHCLVINFFWMLYLINLLKWEINITISSYLARGILLLAVALLILFSWLVMNVWANVLLKNFNKEAKNQTL